MLALVFVDALDLHIKQGGVINQHPQLAAHVLSEALLAEIPHRLPALQEGGVVGIGGKPLQLLKMGAPAIADRLIEQGRQRGVGHRQPAPRCDAVGDIGEALRPDPGQISKQVLLQQGAVQLGHAVDVVAAHHSQVGHAHPALRALLN